MKWYTIIEAVDADTGEMMNQYQIKTGEIIIINKTTKNEYNRDTETGVRTITCECRTNPQTKIEF